MATIGGIDAALWVGRMVLMRPNGTSRGKRRTRKGRGMCSAMIVSVDGDCVVVRPSGHKKTERVGCKDIKPWWARNPDLVDSPAVRTNDGVDRPA